MNFYEYENISTLHVLVSAIVANGGHAIVVKENGVLGDGLPRLPTALAQLRRNAYITTAPAGAGFQVGLGSRTRSIAARWGIALPGPSVVDADA